MKFFKFLFTLFGLLLLAGCRLENAPKGLMIDYPYFITKDSMFVKKIMVPKGTELIYQEDGFNKGKQEKILNEENLKTIKLHNGATIDWGGVPVYEIELFFNTKMHGFTVYANFYRLSKDKKTKFSELWQSCNDGLGVTVKNLNDWSFNPKNISDIESCSVSYQRYFKEDAKQQKFLDSIYNEVTKKK
ncbi:hypothetical protein [Flavobacterium cerinum]|uniref:Lipoprotein n=1 Tax=Flavobacterium cerinum TaxID=2502784 RepID=A0ABY5IPH2_9FLAO|nr:hypothetical protein [Flavobacterium cerinum]UUC44731.1 hypothetical protein NOX80_13960 [Flavobacterium cerinum]